MIDGKSLYRSTDDGVSFERVRILRDEVVAVAPFGTGLVLLGAQLEWMTPGDLVGRRVTRA